MLDVGHAPAAIRAAVLALKAADRGLRSDINKATRVVMSPVWKELITRRSRTRRDRAVLAKGVRIKAGNPPAGIAANSSRALRGGLVPGQQWQVFEFGADPGRVTTYDRKSRNGGTHKVTRHTTRQLPGVSRTGHVVYPSLKAFVPRLVSLWVQTIVRTYHDAAEEAR